MRSARIRSCKGDPLAPNKPQSLGLRRNDVTVWAPVHIRADLAQIGVFLALLFSLILMHPSPQPTLECPTDNPSRDDHRLSQVKRNKRTRYRFVRADAASHKRDELRGLAPNKSLSDTTPRRGIRRFRPTEGPHLEPSLLPIISACSEYPGPIQFVYEVFPNQSTGLLDEFRPNPPSLSLAESTSLPTPTNQPDLSKKVPPTRHRRCTLCNARLHYEWFCQVCGISYQTANNVVATQASMAPSIGTAAQSF